MKIKTAELKRITTDILQKAGLPDEQADAVSSVLVFADERHVWSHGVFRLSSYVDRILKGGVELTPQITVDRPAPSILRIDGHHGMGHFVSTTAMREAISVAEENGICLAIIRRSGHFGMASAYTTQAAEAGHIGIAWTTTSPVMAPWGGREKLLGNNPIAITIPMHDSPPITLDMALSTVAGGKIHAAAGREEEIPQGWALDPAGQDTTDPKAALQGSLLPISSYKGYGLSFITEAIAVALASSIFSFEGPDLWKEPHEKQSSSHLFIVINTKALTPPDDFSQTIRRLADRVRSSDKRPGYEQVFLPGEIEQQHAQQSAVEGIELPSTSSSSVADAAKAVGLAVDWQS